jgi:hypothetical protein
VLTVFGRRLNLGLSGMLDPVAGNVQLQNDAVVDQAIDRCGGGHRIFEDAVPFGKWQVAGEQNTASFIALRQQSEQYFHFFTALLDIAHLLNDEALIAGQLFDRPAEFQITFCGKQLLDQQGACGEVDAPAFLDDQLLRDGAEKVGFPASGRDRNIMPMVPKSSRFTTPFTHYAVRAFALSGGRSSQRVSTFSASCPTAPLAGSRRGLPIRRGVPTSP